MGLFLHFEEAIPKKSKSEQIVKTVSSFKVRFYILKKLSQKNLNLNKL